MSPSLPFMQMGAINNDQAENMAWGKVGELIGSCHAESRWNILLNTFFTWLSSAVG